MELHILYLCVLVSGSMGAPLAPTRLRVEYLERPITIDVAQPRFSWALASNARSVTQNSFKIQVFKRTGSSATALVWDSGDVESNPSGGAGTGSAAGPVPLVSDTDYTWTVSWTDDEGAVSPAAEGSFSTALLKTKQGSSGGTLDWRGAEWISSPGNGSLNTYRTEFNVAGTPARARLYISGK
eukprot:gene17131-31838_t